jgi:predicted AAA+ superfamily ATPase
LKNCVSLDDLEARTEANESPKIFLSKLDRPLIIDEVQKAPHLFDAIKHAVDQKKIPGTFYLTGSSTFSSKIGIRESLTGTPVSIE